MPGDPNQCREHATWCRELAGHTRSADTRATFENLADTWERLAVELEYAQRRRGAGYSPRFDGPPDDRHD